MRTLVWFARWGRRWRRDGGCILLCSTLPSELSAASKRLPFNIPIIVFHLVISFIPTVVMPGFDRRQHSRKPLLVAFPIHTDPPPNVRICWKIGKARKCQRIPGGCQRRCGDSGCGERCGIGASRCGDSRRCGIGRRRWRRHSITRHDNLSRQLFNLLSQRADTNKAHNAVACLNRLDKRQVCTHTKLLRHSCNLLYHGRARKHMR